MSWEALRAGFPPRPDPALDPILDATGRCLERYGPDRTTMSDLARAAGIARSTLYQKVASVDAAAALFAVREFHRFLSGRPEDGAIEGVEDFGRFLTDFVTWIRAEPSFRRLLDEPAVLGRAATDPGPALAVMAAMIAPTIAVLAEAGLVVDDVPPDVTAGWLVRVVVLLCLAPPPGPLDAVVEHLVLPGLRP